MGLKKEGPLPWFGVIQFAKFGLILAPWSGQLIQPNFFSAFSLSRYLKFSKGQIWGPITMKMMASGSLIYDLFLGGLSVAKAISRNAFAVKNNLIKIWKPPTVF